MSKGGLATRVDQALKDDGLRRAVRIATDTFRSGKSKAMAEYDDWEGMRERARAIRTHTVQNLDYYLEQLASKVRENGGYVHFAQTDAEAVDIVRRIAQHHRVKSVAKSKSMISEEIRLNDALEADGLEVYETDLGEYILQLAEETPSHIVGPALHKTREDVAELFSELTGEKLSSDTPTLTAVAREKLREVFLKAEMGITGCNFAVAETGSITLVTNEGNGRMVTSLPRVQVTLMGMERIVPRLEDLDILLTMLTRSATGQKATSYTTITTGPRCQGEKDGPEAFHLVIVDNQRSSILGGDFEEALNCIRCGACLNICPVYRQVGGHAYGWVYSGPIGAVLTPLYKGIEEWGELAQATSLCGACYEACPVKIPLHDMLVDIRQESVEKGCSHPVERWAFKGYAAMMGRPSFYRLAQRFGRLAQLPVVQSGRIQNAPAPVSGWTESRSLPALAPQSFSQIWKEELSQQSEPLLPVARKITLPGENADEHSENVGGPGDRVARWSEKIAEPNERAGRPDLAVDRHDESGSSDGSAGDSLEIAEGEDRGA